MKKKIIILSGLLVLCIGGFAALTLYKPSNNTNKKETENVLILPDYKKLNVEIKESVSDEVIEDYANQELASYKVFEEVKESINEHSAVILDYEEYQNDKLINSEEMTQIDLETETHPAKDIMIGLKAGESKEGTIDNITYKLNIKHVGYLVECNINNVSNNIINNIYRVNSKEELKKLFQKKYITEYTDESKNELIYENLLENSEVSVTEKEFKKTYKKEKKHLSKAIRKSNLSKDEFCETEYGKSYKDYLTYMEENIPQWIRTGKVLDKIGDENDISVDDKDIQNYITANDSSADPIIVNKINLLKVNIDDIVVANATINIVSDEAID